MTFQDYGVVKAWRLILSVCFMCACVRLAHDHAELSSAL